MSLNGDFFQQKTTVPCTLVHLALHTHNINNCLPAFNKLQTLLSAVVIRFGFLAHTVCLRSLASSSS